MQPYAEDLRSNPNALAALRPATGWQLANETFLIPDGDSFLLYNPLAGASLEVNGAAVKAISDFREGGSPNFQSNTDFWTRLIRCGILVSAPYLTPSDIEKRQRLRNAVAPPNTAISLFLTSKCSMRCIYCYARGGERSETMSWDTARGGLDWAIRDAAAGGQKRLDIVFHGGGEVTSVMDLFRRSVTYARQRASESGLSANLSCGLNGVLSPHDAEWTAHSLDSATVSLDGVSQVQDLQRPLVNGRGSFKHVDRTLRIFDQHGFHYGIRMTVTADSIAQLAESIQFICRNYYARIIQAEPLITAGRAVDSHLPPVDANAFIDEFRKARKIAESHGRLLKYSGARCNTVSSRFCEATGRSLCITPSGDITSCYEVSGMDDPRSNLFIYGHFNTDRGEVELDDSKLNVLRSLTVDNKPYCAKCFCKWHCAGDCPAKLALSGDAWNPATSTRCQINMELTKDQIKNRLNARGPKPAEARECSYE